MVFGVEEGLVARIDFEPYVIVAVGLAHDIDHDAGRMLTRINHLQPVWAPYPGFGGAGAASRR